MTKQEWKQPVLEVLDVNLTMASSTPGSQLDATYGAGTPSGELTWS